MISHFFRSIWLALASVLPAQFVEPGAVQLFQVPGRAPGDLFGWRLASLGDANNDGVADFVVAAPFHNLNVGRISLHSGVNGNELWFRDENATSAIFGFDLTTVRDLDNDGVREVVAAAPFVNTGRVHVLSGRTGATLFVLTAPSGSSAFGVSLAAGGDYDGDGAEDLVIADDSNDSTRPDGGQLFVYALPPVAPPRAIAPLPTNVLFGVSLAFLGDTNGDGRDDLAVGDRNTLVGSPGRMHVLAWNGTADIVRWTVAGVEFGSQINGNMFAGGGDVDRDGAPDVVVDEAFPTNRARLFSGATGNLLRTFTDEPNDRCGRGARIVADQNHDGIPDILLGTSNSSVATSNGRLLLFSGRDGRRLLQYTSTTLRALYGSATLLGPDLTNDGWPELIVAARGSSGTSPSMAAVHVMVGQPCLAGRAAYGSGWPGALGEPGLATDVDPVLGAPWTIEMTTSTPGATIALLRVGFAPQAQLGPWGGLSLVANPADLLVSLAPGLTSLPIWLPADPGLCGLVLHGQLLVADPGASASIASSAGLRLALGS